MKKHLTSPASLTALGLFIVAGIAYLVWSQMQTPKANDPPTQPKVGSPGITDPLRRHYLTIDQNNNIIINDVHEKDVLEQTGTSTVLDWSAPTGKILSPERKSVAHVIKSDWTKIENKIPYKKWDDEFFFHYHLVASMPIPAICNGECVKKVHVTASTTAPG